ncbi:MAG: hypothetical protein PQ612_02855 [Rickettsiales bacterium]|nr:hypothetical protein [Pseudomonadota bacterium]MDA0965946.1 hypothetical protein [Pseudomonadota bacterium]MDG4542582.1 hypothetical protein [Rickettsiales bacterium]MDG4545086.1 hypothetical protein [Rickettsiales bacterium]MDG4547209.1 hypothetical protein [Rickettsiales bacterium]
MSIESDIIDGKVESVVRQIPHLEDGRIGSLFLFAVTFEQEEIATGLLEARSAAIDPRIVEEIFKAAAVHNEAELVRKIIKQCGDKLTKTTMLDAAKMAAVERNIKVIKIIAEEGHLDDYINKEDEENPHLLKIAVDTGDYFFIEKLLELPEMEVDFHHIAYAEKRGQHRMSELLKLFRTKETKKYDMMDTVYDYEKDLVAVGPHMQAELERRKRVLSQSRYRL